MLQLACLMMLISTLLAKAASNEQDITWIQPSAGSTFGPGDQIVGEWTADKTPKSVSVSLCNKSTGSCGGTVSPKVTQNGASYTISVAAPSLSSTSDYYLKVTDEAGSETQSPTFSLDPSAKGKQTTNANGSASSSSSGSGSSSSGSSADDSGSDSTSKADSNAAMDQGSQAPMSSRGTSGANNNQGQGENSQDASSNEKGSGSSSSSPSNGKASNAGSATAPDSSSQKPQSPGQNSAKLNGSNGSPSAADSDSSASSANGGANANPGANGNTSSGSSSGTNSGSNSNTGSSGADNNTGSPATADDYRGDTPSVSTHSGVSTAAIAVPLAFVAAAFVASLGLYIARKRSAAEQKKRNERLISIGSQSSYSVIHSRSHSRANSVRSRMGLSREPSSVSSASASAQRSCGDGDIEKAIGALYDYAEKEGKKGDGADVDVVYVPVRAAYPIPREDVRRERMPSMLERASSVLSWHSRSRSHRERDDEQADYDAWDPYTHVRRQRSKMSKRARFLVSRESSVSGSGREKTVYRKTPFPSQPGSRNASELLEEREDSHGDGDGDGWENEDDVYVVYDEDDRKSRHARFNLSRESTASGYEKPVYRKTPFPSTHTSRQVSEITEFDGEGKDGEDDGCTTDAVLSDYFGSDPSFKGRSGSGSGPGPGARRLSPSSLNSKSRSKSNASRRSRDSHSNSHSRIPLPVPIPSSSLSIPSFDFPRSPPQSHSRSIAPEMRKGMGRRSGSGRSTNSQSQLSRSRFEYGKGGRRISRYGDEDDSAEFYSSGPMSR